jgi:hypothetical protein
MCRAPSRRRGEGAGVVNISNEQNSTNSENRKEIATFGKSGSFSIAVSRPLKTVAVNLAFLASGQHASEALSAATRRNLSFAPSASLR